MARGPMSNIAVIGSLAAAAMVLLLMMSLSSMSDPRAAGFGKEVHKNLQRSLVDDPKSTKVSMRASGPEGARVRNYTLRLQPSPAVAANEQAVGRLLRRAAELLSGRLGKIEDTVILRCVAVVGEDQGLELRFRRRFVDKLYVLEPLGKFTRISLKAAANGAEGEAE